MNKDVEKLEEKIKNLEESIKEFESNHNKQVNNLIELFSDVIEIIKNREVKNSEDNTKTQPKEMENNDTYEYNNDYEEMIKNIQSQINLENNEFYGRNPRDIVNTIIDTAKINTQESRSINDNDFNEKTLDDILSPKQDISNNEEVEEPIFNLQNNEIHHINFDDLKIDLNQPLEETNPISIDDESPTINIDDHNKEELEASEDNIKLLKIEKSFYPVQIWIDTFKNNNKYLDVKNELSKYLEDEESEKEIETKRISLGDVVNSNNDAKIFTSQNLNIELGTLEEAGYDDSSALLVMAIDYIDEFNNEKTTFDLYNCKNIEDKENMLKAEQKYVDSNLTSKVSSVCVSNKKGVKIGWIKEEDIKEISTDEMELI